MNLYNASLLHVETSFSGCLDSNKTMLSPPAYSLWTIHISVLTQYAYMKIAYIFHVFGDPYRLQHYNGYVYSLQGAA